MGAHNVASDIRNSFVGGGIEPPSVNAGDFSVEGSGYGYINNTKAAVTTIRNTGDESAAAGSLLIANSSSGGTTTYQVTGNMVVASDEMGLFINKSGTSWTGIILKPTAS